MNPDSRLPGGDPVVALIALVIVLLFALFVASRTIRIIPQARAGVVERLGRYSRTLRARPDDRRARSSTG